MSTLRIKPDSHPTGAQLRAARGLVNMSVLDLAERTGLAPNTIKRAESDNGPAPVNAANAKLMVATLQALGVIFIPAQDDMGSGVRLASPEQPALARRRAGRKVRTAPP
ncbi:helix-turn-helix transcriptional regulator [Brevundimonas sp. WCHBH090558]|uniref:helix-turn-helix domain-containing protein n=1 Tax=Brevundimonas huaxiensis TaxID=2725493 RepID=UPI0016270A63|nr:helix-turn-helix transcriptional regulator [Brevundimonas huaxiensis]MBC1183501.1 helix-turn-helix transcriptional regulator [Brevundimonas huaxiensis]